jgi:hypothetical protein
MSEIRDVMSEWLALKAQLKAARADISVLNKREKELRTEVQHFMKKMKQDVEEDVQPVVKIQGQKVSFQTKESKGSITKEIILKGLQSYFGGNEAQIEGAFQAILDAVPVKERDVLTVRKDGSS